MPRLAGSTLPSVGMGQNHPTPLIGSLIVVATSQPNSEPRPSLPGRDPIFPPDPPYPEQKKIQKKKKE